MKKYKTILECYYKVVKQVFKITPIAGVFAYIYMGIEGLFPAFITYISAQLFDSVGEYLAGSENMGTLSWLGILLVTGYAAQLIFQYLSSITNNAGIYEKVTSGSKQLLYKKYAKISLINYEDTRMIDKKARAEECIRKEIISQIFMLSTSCIKNIISILSVTAVLAEYHLSFILLCFVSVIPYLVIRLIRGKEFYQLQFKQVRQERQKNYLWNLLVSKVSIKELRVFGATNYICEKWKEYRDNVNYEKWAIVKKECSAMIRCDMFRIAGYCLSMVISFMLILEDSISIGIFGACLTAFSTVQEKAKSFFIDVGNLSEKMKYVEDYFSFLNTEDEIIDQGDEIEEIHNIVLKNCEFKYPENPVAVIDDFNIVINKGEKIVILGENGCGKTTFSKLLMGIYNPDSGKIEVNGCEIGKYKKSSFWRKVSVIPQHFSKYYMTVRENIFLSDLAKKNEEKSIIDALKKVELERDIIDCGLDNLLGREFGGEELSEGQWQKLAIARGVFRECEVIIMDEPTSSLDPITEAEILKKFLEISEGKTAVIISHRTGLCTLVDKIAVMKEGRIVEFGTHKELIEKGGEYEKLYSSQQKWYV